MVSYEVGTGTANQLVDFSSTIPSCQIAYKATVVPADPSNAFFTKHSSGKGMEWNTADSAYVGTSHVVTVTATTGCSESKSISYTVRIPDPCENAVISINGTPNNMGYILGLEATTFSFGGGGEFSYKTA